MRSFIRHRHGYRAPALAVCAFVAATGAAIFGQAISQPAAKVPNGPRAATLLKQGDSPPVNALTRGPLHEAYAEPINTGAVKPLVVPKPPPAAVNEVLPDAKPADGNALWISGYWGWDDDRKDFDWVSGVWRIPPPGHRWMSGYWTQVSGGFEWVPGLWWPAASEQVAYYPEPPETAEQGPSGQPPSPDDFWVPGCWQWSDAGYVWQAGQWAAAQPDWMWTPASYYSCARGWVFREGYWDYPLAQRGVIFAPVQFATDAYLRPGFSYSPAIVIDPLLLTFHLFVRPAYCHYYFGDYYATQYDRFGIYPWYSVFERGHFAYDPVFSYYSWYFRGRDPQWLANLRGWHDYYREHPDQRPPHDWAAQRALVDRAAGRRDQRYLAIAQPLQLWRETPYSSVRLAAVSPTERTRIEEAVRQVRKTQTQREQSETRAAGGVATTGNRQPEIAQRRAITSPQRVPAADLPLIGPSESGTPRIARQPGSTTPGTPGPAARENGRPSRPGNSSPRTLIPAEIPRHAPGSPPGDRPRESRKPIAPPEPRGPQPVPSQGRKPTTPSEPPRTEIRRPTPPPSPHLEKERPAPPK